MRTLTALLAAGLAITLAGSGSAQTTPLYEQNVSDSNHLRTEQARELDAYIVAMKTDKSRLHSLFKPDYSSPSAYQRSTSALREAYAKSIGYPPPGIPDDEPPRFKQIGQDSLGTYYRAVIAVLPGVHAEGIYIVPRGLRGKAPVVISMHGGGGSPEVALFHGGSNYHDMVRGGVKRGYIVWAPQHLFDAPGYPGDIRNRIDSRARLVGTTLTAIEVAKITRSLDVILRRPEVDARRVGMVGLSYGGYYALVTPALDARIRASVSSCYFGVQEGRYALDELSVPSDFQTPDRFSLFLDPEMVALICPRALEIQAGSRDDADHREPGKLIAPQAADYYSRLGIPQAFRYVIFDGGHEFNDASAWAFMKAHL